MSQAVRTEGTGDNVSQFRVPTAAAATTEAEMRVHLAAAYRLVAYYGWGDLIYTHISARVPGEPEHFLINPYGMMFSEVTASSLVKIDHEGNIVAPSQYGVNKAGFVIHSAIHMARHDLDCVMHTHTEAGVAVSCLEEGLKPWNQIALRFYNRLGYHDYEGIALDLDERQRLIRDLGNHQNMILRNHGLLAAGRSVGAAFENMWYLERACRMQLQVMASGAKVHELSPETCEHTAQQYDKGMERSGGAPAWPALLRMLDQVSPGYRA